MSLATHTSSNLGPALALQHGPRPLSQHQGTKEQDNTVSIKAWQVLLGLGIFYFAYQAYKLRQAIQLQDAGTVNKRLALGGWHLFQYFIQKEDIRKLAAANNSKALSTMIKKIDFQKVIRSGRISRAAEAVLSLRDDPRVDHLQALSKSLYSAFETSEIPSLISQSLSDPIFEQATQIAKNSDRNTIELAMYQVLFIAVLEQACRKTLQKILDQDSSQLRASKDRVLRSFHPRSLRDVISEIAAHRCISIPKQADSRAATKLDESIYVRHLETNEDLQIPLRSLLRTIFSTTQAIADADSAISVSRSVEDVLRDILEDPSVQRAIAQTAGDPLIQEQVKQAGAAAAIQEVLEGALPLRNCPRSQLLHSVEYSTVDDAETRMEKRIIPTASAPKKTSNPRAL